MNRGKKTARAGIALGLSLLILAAAVSACGRRGAGGETGSGSLPERTAPEGQTPAETPSETPEETEAPERETPGTEPSVPRETEPAEVFTETDDVIYALDALNVRAQASTEAEKLGVLQPGEAVRRTGIGEEWMRVSYMGRTAYVAAAYISSEKPAPPETAAPTNPPALENPSAAEGTGILYGENDGPLIAVDAGHQAHGNSDPEPVGPGASETKAKVSSGTVGTVTGIPEHELNLAVSLYLRDELLARGYRVLMIRESADVDISNAERAALANEYGAAAFIRIHANAVSDPAANGALSMCMTARNPYNAGLYEDSRALSESVLDALCAATGAKNRGVTETDTMSGINWCEVPVTIVEMGFMTNPDEDAAMASEEYRRALAEGIADGIDRWME